MMGPFVLTLAFLSAVSVLGNKTMPLRIAHKQSNELYNVTLGVFSQRGTQANGKQTVHCKDQGGL